MSTPYNPAEPGAGNGPAGWDSSQPSLLSAAKDTVATSVPRGLGVVGSAKAGYAAGKMLGAERAGNQPAPTDGGWANEEANDNGDGGSDSEFATKEDIGGLHKKLDAMSAGMQNQGPVASRSRRSGKVSRAARGQRAHSGPRPFSNTISNRLRQRIRKWLIAIPRSWGAWLIRWPGSSSARACTPRWAQRVQGTVSQPDSRNRRWVRCCPSRTRPATRPMPKHDLGDSSNEYANRTSECASICQSCIQFCGWTPDGRAHRQPIIPGRPAENELGRPGQGKNARYC